jgi:hypothetical protein
MRFSVVVCVVGGGDGGGEVPFLPSTLLGRREEQ